MAGSSIKIDNVNPIVRIAQALGPDARAASGSAVYKGAKVIADAARSRVPRSAKPRTGGWRTGVHVADVLMAERAKASKFVTSGVTVPGGLSKGGHFYLRFLEHGTTKMKAGKYVAQTAEAVEATVEETVIAELKQKLGL